MCSLTRQRELVSVSVAPKQDNVTAVARPSTAQSGLRLDIGTVRSKSDVPIYKPRPHAHQLSARRRISRCGMTNRRFPLWLTLRFRISLPPGIDLSCLPIVPPAEPATPATNEIATRRPTSLIPTMLRPHQPHHQNIRHCVRCNEGLTRFLRLVEMALWMVA